MEEIEVGRSGRGVVIRNRGREAVRILSATLSYRYTVASASAAQRPEQAYASRLGSERFTVNKHLGPGESHEIEFYPPELVESVELVVETRAGRAVVKKGL